jgi:LysM repeat protein
MYQRARRSPARFVAPLALVVVTIAFLAIVAGSGDSGSSPASTGTDSTTVTQASSAKTKSSTTRSSADTDVNPKSYVVRVGDNLSTIADKTGVALETLQELNPDVDPHTMTAGQKIRLR